MANLYWGGRGSLLSDRLEQHDRGNDSDTAQYLLRKQHLFQGIIGGHACDDRLPGTKWYLWLARHGEKGDSGY